jgi:ribonuclease D
MVLCQGSFGGRASRRAEHEQGGSACDTLPLLKIPPIHNPKSRTASGFVTCYCMEMERRQHPRREAGPQRDNAPPPPRWHGTSSTIDRNEIALLRIRRYGGPVCLISTAHDLERALQDIRRQTVVGVDTETQPVFQKGQTRLPCLVQIATARAVYLFQLRRMDFSSALAELFSNPAIIKAGIGLARDLLQLKKLFPFDEKNVLDIGDVAQRHGVRQSGVRNLAGMFLGFRVAKGHSTSNWARPRLSSNQIIYAATDAWVCYELFQRFQHLGLIQ